jgi:DNA invertase Pin-like site-specific DNA recombinase
MTTSLISPPILHSLRSRRKAVQAAARHAITSARCVAAIRGSTERQRLTIPTQGAAISRYCEAKGLEMAAAFIDSGTCGKTPWLERENVRDMLAFMASHGIQQIVYTCLDRAFRSTGDAMLTLHECANAGVRIHFCEQDIDPNTPMGKAMMQIIAVFAELETDLRLQRQIETVETMRASCFKAGINVPYGWDKVPSASRQTHAAREKFDLEVGSKTAFDLVPNWEEQDVLREILRRTEPPLQQSDAEIARILNAAGIPAKKGGKWHPATVFSVRSYARLAGQKISKDTVLG